MGKYRDIGARLVASANPRFKDLRVDFEKISNAACKAAREGREGLSPEDAPAMFVDGEWDIRIPLQHRYAQAGAFDAVSHYHAKRFKLLLGRNTPWPDEPGRDALEMFARYGRAPIGVALIRAYVDMQLKRLKKDYAKRNPRGPRGDLDEGSKRLIGRIDAVIANAVPDRKAELLKDMETVAPYLEEHGSGEDRAWFESVRREIWMEKRA